MKRTARCLILLTAGSAYAALAVFCARLLVRNLSSLFCLIGGAASLDEGVLAYGQQILAQLSGAVIASPWLCALPIGGAASLFSAWLLRRGRRRRTVLTVLVWVLLLIPCALTALWFTSVNGIRVGSLLKILLPLLPHLL